MKLIMVKKRCISVVEHDFIITRSNNGIYWM